MLIFVCVCVCVWQVLPRVVLEAFPAEFITKKKQWRKAIDIIVKECEYDFCTFPCSCQSCNNALGASFLFKYNKYSSVNREMGYDGIVLESWSRWAAYGVLQDPDMRLMVNLKLLDA